MKVRTFLHKLLIGTSTVQEAIVFYREKGAYAAYIPLSISREDLKDPLAIESPAMYKNVVSFRIRNTGYVLEIYAL